MAILYEMSDGSDEYTSIATCDTSNSVVYVAFDNLNPAYGYEIEYVIPDTPSTDVKIPKWKKLKQENGTNTDTIKLTYELSGATSGVSQFALRIKR